MSLSDKIQNILNARDKIKAKIERNQMENMMVSEELEKMAPVLHKPLIHELQQQQQNQPLVYPAPPQQMIESRKIKKRKVYDLDPDKDIDEDLLKTLNLSLPSEILKAYEEPERSQIVEVVVAKVNHVLRSLGGKKRQKKENDEVSEMIDSLRHYKDSIKALQNIPRFQIGKGNKEAMVKRLELVIASRLAGNDSDELVKEAMSILDLLIKERYISKSDYSKIISNYGLDNGRIKGKRF
jgi:hypothetical protein